MMSIQNGSTGFEARSVDIPHVYQNIESATATKHGDVLEAAQYEAILDLPQFKAVLEAAKVSNLPLHIIGGVVIKMLFVQRGRELGVVDIDVDAEGELDSENIADGDAIDVFDSVKRAKIIETSLTELSDLVGYIQEQDHLAFFRSIFNEEAILRLPNVSSLTYNSSISFFISRSLGSSTLS